MNILIISQYFYPENFRVNDLVFSLKKKGHNIEVLTGKPNYPKGSYSKGYSWKKPSFEVINNIPIHRANLFLRGKAGGTKLFINYISFVFFGFFKLLRLKGSFDKVFVYAPSPITVGFLGIHFCTIFVSPVPYIYYVLSCVLTIFRYLRALFSPLCFLLLILFHLLLLFFCIIVCSLFLVPSLFYFCAGWYVCSRIRWWLIF